MSTAAKPTTSDTLQAQLTYLKLPFVREHFEPLAKEAAQAHWGHVDYLAGLIEGEALDRQQRAIERRIRLARFPVVKTLESFQWNWPRKINRLQVLKSIPPAVHRGQGQRYPSRRGWPRQNTSGFSTRLCRLSEGLLGALCHRRGCDQYPGWR